MSITTDPSDTRIKRGPYDTTAVPQNEVYLALSQEEFAKGYLKPYRRSYKHKQCGSVTSMPEACAQTYARDPWFYGGTYCCACQMHRPLSEFTWVPDGEPMNPADWTDAEVERVGALRAALKEQQPK